MHLSIGGTRPGAPSAQVREVPADKRLPQLLGYINLFVGPRVTCTGAEARAAFESYADAATT